MEIKPGEFTVTELLDWSNRKSLVLAPKFQRREIWSIGARSYLIDTILQRLPVPPIYFRHVRDTAGSSRSVAQTSAPMIVREVVDGQQRLKAVLDFIDGSYSLWNSLKAPYSGRSFKQLTRRQQDSILQYSFQCWNMFGVSDELVIQIFARLNTYTTQLNRQELRNGRFFGPFKQLAYKLAAEYLGFWRRKGIFSETAIARMREAELTSELLIAGLHGQQDKKLSIDDYYERYDETFARAASSERRFTRTLAAIDEALGDDLEELEFSRAPLFYSLYCAVYHRMFGLPNEKLRTPKVALTKREQARLREAAVRLSAVISESRDDEANTPPRFQTFVNACLRQTDNIGPRTIRLRELYRQAF